MWWCCLQSLPVAFGPEAAKWICVGAIDITQLSIAGMTSWFIKRLELLKLFFFCDSWTCLLCCFRMTKFSRDGLDNKTVNFINEIASLGHLLMTAGYLLGAGKPYYALALVALIAPQVFFQVNHREKKSLIQSNEKCVMPILFILIFWRLCIMLLSLECRYWWSLVFIYPIHF